jgi:GntR family transcriptional regulator / MocR family aminotransferase
VHFLEKNGVIVYPVEKYALLKGNHKNKLVLGYGSLTVEQIINGVTRLKEGIHTFSNQV